MHVVPLLNKHCTLHDYTALQKSDGYASRSATQGLTWLSTIELVGAQVVLIPRGFVGNVRCCLHTGLADTAWTAFQSPESLVYSANLWTERVAGLPAASPGPSQAVCEASAIR